MNHASRTPMEQAESNQIFGASFKTDSMNAAPPARVRSGERRSAIDAQYRTSSSQKMQRSQDTGSPE